MYGFRVKAVITPSSVLLLLVPWLSCHRRARDFGYSDSCLASISWQENRLFVRAVVIIFGSSCQSTSWVPVKAHLPNKSTCNFKLLLFHNTLKSKSNQNKECFQVVSSKSEYCQTENYYSSHKIQIRVLLIDNDYNLKLKQLSTSINR